MDSSRTTDPRVSPGAVSVTLARTPEDYRKAWAVRYQAYVEFGHIAEGDFEKIRDWRDAIAKTFLASAPDSSEIVGTIRIIVTAPDDFEGREYIAPFIQTGERAGELTKLAVLPAYRRGIGQKSVFGHLATSVFRYLQHGELDALYLVTIDENAQIYERMGFVRISKALTFAGYPRDHFVLKASNTPETKARYERFSQWLGRS